MEKFKKNSKLTLCDQMDPEIWGYTKSYKNRVLRRQLLDKVYYFKLAIHCRNTQMYKHLY